MTFEHLPWSMPPGWPLILGGLLLAGLSPRLRARLLPVPALLALMHLERFDHGAFGQVMLAGQTLTLARLDVLSTPFAWLFGFAALIGSLYLRGRPQRHECAAGLIYAGAAIGAVCAGDLLSLFLYWELTALASTLLLFPDGGRSDYGVALRYLIIQVVSGVLLMGGSLLHLQETGSLAFDTLTLDGAAGVWILAAFAIKAAFPLLHGWAIEAYPSASPAGTVLLGTFTTKLAIYALARSFAGLEMLIPIGVVMIVFTLVQGLREDDLRRTLVYGLINQLGFMVIAIGIGTPLALSAAVAHAISHVLYSGLLFMALGVVLLRAGTTRVSELSGLARQMPWTFGFCLIGALGMAAPLFAGFASKSLILAATHEAQQPMLAAILKVGSVGIFIMAGLKILYPAFLGAHRGSITVRDAPVSMRTAMLLSALALLLLGIRPDLIFGALGDQIRYPLYTPAHVLEQIGLLAGSILVFALLMRRGFWPRQIAGVRDIDALQQRMPNAWKTCTQLLQAGGARGHDAVASLMRPVSQRLHRDGGEESVLIRSWQTGSMALWVAIALSGYLLLYFVSYAG
ncbi:MAG: proton-conducting transporter membrane subunit [Pseudomonadota bacterium]